MKKARHSNLMFLFLTVMLFVDTSYAQSQNELLTKLDAGQRDLIKNGKGITFSKKTTFYGPGDVSKIYMESFERIRYFGKVCYVLESDLADGKIADDQSIVPTVSCLNSKYLFTLRKSIGSTEWQLSKAIMLDQKTELEKLKMDPESILNQLPVQNHYSNSFDIPLNVLLKDPTCKIGKVFPSPAHKDCISFEYSTGDMAWDKMPNIRCKFSGQITLDVGKSYSVKHAAEKLSTPSMAIEVEREIEVKSVNNCYLLESENKTTTTTIGSKANPKIQRVITHNYAVDHPQSEDEFKLTHYGLPEPEGVVWEKPIPSYVWYLSIAGGALVLFFLAGWLLKRRARARAAAATTTSTPPKPPAG